ncbi:MAG TPA: hypothetical protein VHX68_09115 [Planctomycetaceae bacterium]|nr:hypothetical protein [Planctomycetaceae bacterium]
MSLFLVYGFVIVDWQRHGCQINWKTLLDARLIAEIFVPPCRRLVH